MTVWQWDPSLYSGSADYYATGRMPYPPGVIEAIRQTLGLDGTGRLLDVGAGPGSLTLPLAGFFGETVALDADADMVETGRIEAESRGLRSISWKTLRAEELPADLGKFRAITFAQSFHWMDQPVVAGIVAGMLEEDGSVVHVAATTDRGTGDTPRTSLHYPQPPWEEIRELVARYLGEERRAGKGFRPTEAFGTEHEVFAAAGFGEPKTFEVPHNVARIRTVKEIVAAVYSLSYSAPHLFGDKKDDFDAELHDLLSSHAASGVLFAEQVGSVRLTFWAASSLPKAAPVKKKSAAAKKASPAKKTSPAAKKAAPAAKKAPAPRKAVPASTRKTAVAEKTVPAPRPKARRVAKKAQS